MKWLHINIPEADVSKINVMCPFCMEEREVVSWTYEWYGPEHTCLTCGYSTRDPKNEMTDAEVEKNIKHALAALGEEHE